MLRGRFLGESGKIADQDDGPPTGEMRGSVAAPKWKKICVWGSYLKKIGFGGREIGMHALNIVQWSGHKLHTRYYVTRSPS